MKLNNRELRQIFLLNIKERAPKTFNECPSPKQMLRLFRGKTSEKNKTKIIDHITTCCYCFQEFEFIVKALRFEEDMNQAVQKFQRNKKNKDSSPPLLSWRLAPFVAGAALLCIMFTIFIISDSQDNQKFRATNLSQINLFRPQKKILSKSSLFFQWESIKDSEYYTLEVYDETLYQIWASNKIYKNSYMLSKDISSRLEANKPYFWMISAYYPNGRKIESPLKEIFLTK